MWKEWVLALLGLVTLAVPFLGLAGNTLTWTLVILGAAIAILGFWDAAERSPRSTTRRYQQQ